MRKKSDLQSGIFNLRVVIAVVLCTMGGSLGWLSFAATPPGGTISTNNPSLAWDGDKTGAPTAGGEAECAADNCDSFELTIDPSVATAGKRVNVQINWTLPATDYDMYVHKGGVSGAIVGSSASGGTTQEQVVLDPSKPNIGTGLFTVRVVYFASVPGVDQYHGSAALVDGVIAPVAAPVSSVGPRFENFNPPAAGPDTLGRFSGEPSIGVGLPIAGHPEGRAMFQSDVQTLRVTFNGSLKPTWVNKPAPTSQVDFDPILWTDRLTGQTVVHLLTFAANVIAGESSVSPDDGETWIPSTGTGIGSGVDHQTVGGGAYHEPLPALLPNPVYPRAVYYCSQALVDASCARSDDGGINYGASTITYTDECGGLHGHVKVGPDGIVYLPNKGCGGEQGVVVSEDNGLKWVIRPMPGSTSAGSDPAAAIDDGGKLYFTYADGDTKAVVSTSTDQGRTWSQPLDIGAALGINNVAFPAAVAGDAGRAAIAFLGTPTVGGLTGPTFPGVWHLYVAATYDGGTTWQTVDATPNDPVQRGCIWMGGGSNICRNLLDFMDVTIDQQGRILVGYADGCAGGECVQAPSTASGNSYTALAAIARQSGGPRLLAQFDPPNAATKPGKPSLSARRDGSVINLSWSEADNGGAQIKQYNIYRGTVSGGETFLKSVRGTLIYSDTTANDSSLTYFYKVTATNGVGTSDGDNEVSARYVGSSATGYMVAADPTGDQKGAPVGSDKDIQMVSIAQPSSGTDAGKLVFNLKVASLSTPTVGRWFIFWNSPQADGGQFYLGMAKDASGNVSYEYGTVKTSVTGFVLGVPNTKKLGVPDSATATLDGNITIAVSRDKIGNVQAGDLLGAISARTYDTAGTTQVRSTDALDTTGNASANDSTANAATYLVTSGAATTGGKKPRR